MKYCASMFLIVFIMTSYSQRMYQYCKFTPQHTLCNTRTIGQACGAYQPVRGVSDSDRTTVLAFHNDKRAKVAHGSERRGATGPHPSASNMMLMEWDDELAMLAQRHADQCVFDHDCHDCRRTSRFSAGQNMYITFESNFLDTPDWQKVINAWYDEVDLFDTRIIHSYRFEMATGHYTQMIWAETAYIGCGFTMFKDGGWYKKLYVCNYGPAGNTITFPVYKIGVPCSDCPVGSSCSKSYPMLCSYDGSYSEQSNFLLPHSNQKLSTFSVSTFWIL